MIKWQPIEIAPRDGRAVLVMRDIWPGTQSGRAETCNDHNTYVAQWWSDEPDGDGGKGAWMCYMDTTQEPRCPVEPTHWMALPPPPVETESDPDFFESLARFREAFVIAVGDKSPFAKCALAELDAAIANSRGD
jgi:hypothetical protein